MPIHPVDAHVGMRLRQRRFLLGLSQTRLGAAVALRFQRIQKYEHGTNRIGSSRLFEFARALGVPVSYFFDDMAAPPATPKTGRAGRKASRRGRKRSPPAVPALGKDNESMARRETLALVRAYDSIGQAPVRKKLFQMVKALAAADYSDSLRETKKR
jgi:transcriptional regulator with XRE-family HTH domain